MNDIVFTDYIYELLKQQRAWPNVLGHTLMSPAGREFEILKRRVFEMFDLNVEHFSIKSDHDTFIACLLYNMNWYHMVDLIKKDVGIHK